MLLAHSVLLDALEVKRCTSLCPTSYISDEVEGDYAVPSEFGAHGAESEYFRVMDTVDAGEWDAWCGIEEGDSDGEEEEGGIEP